jgi:hypothetical protein
MIHEHSHFHQNICLYNISIANFNYFLTQTGSTWFSESIYFYTVAPFGIFGILLNILSIIILVKLQDGSFSIFKYMRVFTINSLVLSLMIFLFIFTHLPRHFQFSITYLARFYRCVIMINLANMLNFYESVLNILIMLERISSFVLKYKKYTNIPPYKTSLLCLIGCILVCIPTYFLSKVQTQVDFIYHIEHFNESQIELKYCHKTEFSQSIYGKIIISMVIIIMNGLTVLVEIYLTTITLINFRKYLRKRSSLHSRNNKSKTLLLEIRRDEGENQITKKSSFKNIKSEGLSSILNKSSHNLIKMSLQFSFISSFANILVLFYNFIMLFNSENSLFYYYITFSACLATLIKLCLNFFFFYLYNSSFRKCFKEIFQFNR